MPKLTLDFILPTCPGLADGMWLTASAYIVAMTKICWKLLAPLVGINLLWKGLYDASDSRIDLLGFIKLFIQLIGLIFFLKYVKRLLFTFDLFIDFLCPTPIEVTWEATQQTAKGLGQAIQDVPQLNLVNRLLKGFMDAFNGLFCFSHDGAIKMVHYFKSIILILLSIFSPLAATFSLLPGPFKKSFQLGLEAI